MESEVRGESRLDILRGLVDEEVVLQLLLGVTPSVEVFRVDSFSGDGIIAGDRGEFMASRW